MNEDRKYNGWTNYETWCVNLWMGNDEGSDGYWRERAQDAYDNAGASRSFTREEQATIDLYDAMKDEYEDANPVQDSSLWSDLMSAALSEVNWYEIAEHWIEDVEKEEEESEEE